MAKPNIKLIALDLDGTLLYQHREIKPRNLAAIAAARQQGVAVTIATGRMYRSAMIHARTLQLDLPLITYEGALIRTMAGETLLDQAIPQELAREIVAFAQAEGLIVQAYIDDHCCVSHINYQTARYALISEIPLIAYGDLAAHIWGPCHKILCAGGAERCDAVWQKAAKLYGGQLEMTKSQPTFLEFTALGVNKGSALHDLRGKLGLKKEEIMVAGDNLNDMELFAAAGLKIAMGNAVAALKERADFVTAPCVEDGVAVAIEKFVLS